MPVLRTKTNRMWLPDALRGLALLNMLVYHGMYDWEIENVDIIRRSHLSILTGGFFTYFPCRCR